MFLSSSFKKLYTEIGVEALIDAPKDAKNLSFQRLVRLFAYGSTTLILALFLSDLGFSDAKVGMFMTLTLVGDFVVSIFLTIFADSIGRRISLGIGSLLMTASGVIFALTDNYWALLAASILGVISPSANEVDPFKAVEESTISLLVPLHSRSSVFAWYILFGMAGQAGGTILAGWAVQRLQLQSDWTAIDAYRIVFWSYAVFGVFKLILCCFLTDKCEEGKRSTVGTLKASAGETSPLLRSQISTLRDHQLPAKRSKTRAVVTTMRQKLPPLSTQSVVILSQLCLLFAIDSIASGLAPVSWITFYFKRKFDSGEGTLGTALFVSSIVSSALNLVSSSLSRHIGFIPTMVICHLPASVTLALLPIPSSVAVAMALLIFRMATKDMDMAPRQAFIAAAFTPEERTAVMGIINIVRTICISVGPAVTGALATSGRFWIAFVIAGCLKVLYNLLMVTNFWNYKTREEQESSWKEEEERRKNMLSRGVSRGSDGSTGGTRREAEDVGVMV